MTNLKTTISILNAKTHKTAQLLAIDLETKTCLVLIDEPNRSPDNTKPKTLKFTTMAGYKTSEGGESLSEKNLAIILKADEHINHRAAKARKTRAANKEAVKEDILTSTFKAGKKLSFEEWGVLNTEAYEAGDEALMQRLADYAKETGEFAPQSHPEEEENIPYGILATTKPDSEDDTLLYIEDLAAAVGIKSKTLRKKLRNLSEGTDINEGIVKTHHTWCFTSDTFLSLVDLLKEGKAEAKASPAQKPSKNVKDGLETIEKAKKAQNTETKPLWAQEMDKLAAEMEGATAEELDDTVKAMRLDHQSADYLAELLGF